jgi:hypothetical protein
MPLLVQNQLRGRLGVTFLFAMASFARKVSDVRFVPMTGEVRRVLE